MAIENDELLFNQGLCERTQRFRKERNLTQQHMATLLGVPVDRYRKYETRSPLPHYLVERFCLIVDCTMDELLLGTPRKARKPALVSDKPKSRKSA